MDTRSAERNDVDISQLFKWKKEVKIQDTMTGNYATFYLRLLGDADIGRARSHAYRKAGEIRKELKASESGERLSLLAEIDEFQDKDTLITAILILVVRDHYQKAMKRVEIKEPQEPTADSQEAWEEYQKAVDEYPNKFSEEVAKVVVSLQDAEREKLKKLELSTLYRIYENEAVSRLAQEKMTESFYDMCIYLSTYLDEECKRKAFNSFEDAENAHPSVKEILIENYRKLELGTDTLKQSPGVTE